MRSRQNPATRNQSTTTDKHKFRLKRKKETDKKQ